MIYALLVVAYLVVGWIVTKLAVVMDIIDNDDDVVKGGSIFLWPGFPFPLVASIITSRAFDRLADILVSFACWVARVTRLSRRSGR